MEWSKLYGPDSMPESGKISGFIDSPLWGEINKFLRDTYGAEPKVTYSRCSAQMGWNVKYQKGGKSLCTLYPMEGFYIALVVIGEKEIPETELILPTCCDYIQELYKSVRFSCGGKWLMINVTSPEILSDVIRLIKIRVRPKTKSVIAL